MWGGVGGGGGDGSWLDDATGMGPVSPHTAEEPLVFGACLVPVPAAVAGSVSDGFAFVVFMLGPFLIPFSPPCISVLMIQM